MIAALAGFTCLKLDVDREDTAARTALGALGVASVPTLIFLDAQGREVRRMVGVQPVAQILSAVQRTLEAGPR